MQVAAALRKIAGHIGHPKKFAKASQLLRELLAQVGLLHSVAACEVRWLAQVGLSVGPAGAGEGKELRRCTLTQLVLY